jgi:hypothetical protein
MYTGQLTVHCRNRQHLQSLSASLVSLHRQLGLIEEIAAGFPNFLGDSEDNLACRLAVLHALISQSYVLKIEHTI